ncbi:MAG: hypothetical protein WEC34_06345 [Acidimicrobiia bacterium]
MTDYRFPKGVEYLGEDGSHARFKVTIPSDDEGFFGRECPVCEQVFRMAQADYERLPDDLHLWCVYCGHRDDHSEFMTTQQRERVMRAASDYAVQMVGKALGGSLGSSTGGRRSGLIRVSFRTKPFYPAPLPEIDEERLVRSRACGKCDVRYAVFGEHRFCPVCGVLPPLVAALEAFAADRLRLDALDELPFESRSVLRESGVLDRTYVDTIENVVGTVEMMADRVFRDVVPESAELLRGRGRVFQRLDDLADLFVDHVHTDVRSKLAGTWNSLLTLWAARHVFAHCDGMVDSKYIATVPTTAMREGQRLGVNLALARSAIADAEKLCRAIDEGSA